MRRLRAYVPDYFRRSSDHRRAELDGRQWAESKGRRDNGAVFRSLIPVAANWCAGRCVVRCVVFFRVEGMDIFIMLDRELLRASTAGLPLSWMADPRLASQGSASALSSTVRAIGRDSDAVVEALLTVDERRELADCIIVAATVGLVRSRCRRGPIPPEELLAEVAISVAESRRDGAPATERHLVNVLVDRAWDRARGPYQRSQCVTVVASDLVERFAVADGDVERLALNRVALLEFRERLRADARRSPAAVRAWNSAVELIDVPSRSRVQLDRWKYARRQLRRHGSPDLAA